MAGNTMYGARARTQQDKARDCLAFIFNARASALLAITPEKLLAEKGVTHKATAREITVKLLAAQEKERRREA
jgi:hypothetical protein